MPFTMEDKRDGKDENSELSKKPVEPTKSNDGDKKFRRKFWRRFLPRTEAE